MDKKVCIRTNCCAVQRNETYRISEFFRVNGWQETENIEEADVVVITTCGVTEETEADSFGIVEDVYKRAYESARIVISGCLPNICIDKLKRSFPHAQYIPMDNLGLFDLLIDSRVSISSVFYNVAPMHHHSKGDPRLDAGKYDKEYDAALKLDNLLNTNKCIEAYNYSTQGRYLWKDDSIFEIKVSSGCAQHCSYCASRFGVGNYRSKTIANILHEVDIAVSNGYNNIMLMGDEIGAYGIDINSTLPELLRCILEKKDSLKVGIRYIHPTYLHKYISELGTYLSRVFFVCISIQSASIKVLRDMNRDDAITEIENDIIRIRKDFPELYLHTQIIIGFPTETFDDFMETIDFLKKCRFDYIRYNVFSPREKTEAYGLEYCYDLNDLEKRKIIMRDYCKANRKETLYDRYIKIIADSGKE